MMGNLPNVTLLLWVLFIYTTGAFSIAAGCIDGERRALVKFRASLVDKANRLSSWTGEDCCAWVGITCNNLTGHVEKLDLHNPIQSVIDDYAFDSNLYNFYLNNCLGGEINPSFLNLEHLQYLDLSSNDFLRIQIPTFLGSLKNLRYLNLSGAGFSGEIPYHLGNLSNLLYLDLSSSYGLTAKNINWIAGLVSLKSLDFSQANLTECHDWLNSVNMLPSLSSLNLRRCQLPGTASPPLSVVNLTSLVSLDLGYNFLGSTLPFLLLNLSTQISVLRLGFNNLQFPIHTMLGKLTSLSVLDLFSNDLNSSYLPINSLCNQTNLIYLNLRVNKLEGSLPLCLGNLTFLSVLALTQNKFGGNIPSELGHLKQLSILDLSVNDLKSSIPSSFGGLTKLKGLDLSFNQLYGTIPSTLGQLTKLQEFDISGNPFTGVLPQFLFAKLKNLKLLSIDRNYFLTLNFFSQWIPPFQLRFLSMSSMQIGNHFPPWFQTQRNVASLSMRNASISC